MKKLLLCLLSVMCLCACLFLPSCGDDNTEGKTVITVPEGYFESNAKDSQDLEYRLSNDGTYYAVCSVGSCTDTDIVIPREYNDKPVKIIDPNAFANCASIVTVTIPDTVSGVGEGAFSWCQSLIRVTLGKSITFIGDFAFDSCYKLTEVYNRSSLAIVAGNEEHGKIGLYALSVATTSKSSIKKTDDGFRFYKNGAVCHLLGYEGDKTELTLPDSFEGMSYEIHPFALSGKSEITKITVPKGVTSIGDYAFSGCHNLSSITLPTGLTSIGKFAFQSCFCLDIVSVPDTVTSIGEFAFFSCPLLRVINIPKSVVTIGKNAFSGCMSLTINTTHNSEPSGWEGFNPNERPVIYAP